MEIKSLKESEKKILENLAVEFSDDFLKQNNGHRQINLYGKNGRALIFFEHEIQNKLLERNKKISIVFGRKGSYNIDVGFFLNVGHYKGLNKY